MASTNDYLRLHFIVFLWGFSAILGRLVSVPALEMIFFRFILAAAGLYLVIYFKKESITVSRTDIIKLMAIGVVVFLHWLSFFGSARISNVSVSLVGFATNSLWAALLEPLFNRSKIKKTELLLGLCVLAGLYIIFSFDFQYRLGLLVGIFAGFTAALFSVLNSRMVKRVNSRTIAFYEMCSGFLCAGFFLWAYKLYGGENVSLQLEPSAADWLYIALLAGVCSVYAYTVAIELSKKVSVFVIQLTLNLEPLYGIAMAVFIFGDKEKMPANFYAGAFLILCVVLSYPLFKKRWDKPVLTD